MKYHLFIKMEGVDKEYVLPFKDRLEAASWLDLQTVTLSEPGEAQQEMMLEDEYILKGDV